MELTAKEAKLISEIGRQIGAECVALGLKEADITAELMAEMFIARCQRNIQLANEYLNGARWANTLTQGMAIDVYHEARKRHDVARFCQQIRDAANLEEYRAAVRALDEACNSNVN